MYLNRLFKQNKYWFIIVMLFIIGQLFINYKHGVEFSPFYHYGMFSIVFQKKAIYDVTEVMVDGKPLRAENFTPNGWDNIVMPVTQYQNQQSWNSLLYNTTIRRLLNTNDSSLYTNQLPEATFNQWYRQRIIRLLQLKDTTADIRYHIVSYKQNHSSLYR